MFISLFLKPRICFSPSDEGGGDGGAAAAVGADPAAGAGDDTQPAAAGADTMAGGGKDTHPDGATARAGDDPAAGSKWWEDAKFKDHRDLLEAKGLTVEDKDEVIAKLVAGEKAAQLKLGKPADQLLTKPGKDETVVDWMKANGEMFGIPESADKYDIAKPDAWPKDAKWDDALEGKVRDLGLAKGMSNEAVNAMVGLYAENIMALDKSSTDDLAAANTAMMTELEKDWGGKTEAKLALAGQAASVIAEKAGLDQTAMLNLGEALKPKVGDAGAMRIFAAIGEMMSDDQMVMGDGGTSLATTPADARAQLQTLQAPGGEYFEAVQKKDQANIARLKPQIDRLTKIAAG